MGNGSDLACKWRQECFLCARLMCSVGDLQFMPSKESNKYRLWCWRATLSTCEIWARDAHGNSVCSLIFGGWEEVPGAACGPSVSCLSHTDHFFPLSLKFVLGTRAGKHLIPSLAQQIKKFKPYKATSAVGSKSTSSALCHLQATHLHVLWLYPDLFDPIRKKETGHLPSLSAYTFHKCLSHPGFRMNCLYVEHPAV